MKEEAELRVRGESNLNNKVQSEMNQKHKDKIATQEKNRGRREK